MTSLGEIFQNSSKLVKMAHILGLIFFSYFLKTDVGRYSEGGKWARRRYREISTGRQEENLIGRKSEGGPQNEVSRP